MTFYFTFSLTSPLSWPFSLSGQRGQLCGDLLRCSFFTAFYTLHRSTWPVCSSLSAQLCMWESIWGALSYLGSECCGGVMLGGKPEEAELRNPLWKQMWRICRRAHRALVMYPKRVLSPTADPYIGFGEMGCVKEGQEEMHGIKRSAYIMHRVHPHYEVPYVHLPTQSNTVRHLGTLNSCHACSTDMQYSSTVLRCCIRGSKWQII